MALADPQSIKIGATESSLPRVSTGNYNSTYQSEDGKVVLKLSTVSNGKRKRQVYRVDLNKITEDPFDDSQNVEVSMSCYIVLDRPLVGFSNTEAYEALKGLVDTMSASSYKTAKQLIASES